MKNPPKEIYVYWAEENDGTKYPCIAQELDEIPEDQDGNKVATYRLSHAAKFSVHRELSGK